MSYKIRFDDITSFQTTSQTSIASWGQSIASINTAMSDFINDSSLQGEGIAGIRTYLSEVHGTLLQTLINLMNDYSSSFLLYKDGYYNIDSDHHAELPEQVFTTLQSDLKNSHDRFNHQLELLNAEKDKISDLVSYSGTSHTSTALDYGVLTTKLTTLDNAIQQYESNHARQDLTAFKELVSATKALLSEYSGQTRKISSYRSGDLGKLQSVERFATAYQQVEQHITNTMDKVQAAQERDRVRFEALAAEERKTQGWIDLALGAVTIAVGVAAIVASGGAATPLVAGAWIAGSGTVAYGLSNTVEAGHNLYLGYQGDGKTHATNPIRDTLFMGNDKTYHQVGGLFTTASAVLIPIGKTQSFAKGLTEFTIGEVGGFAGHQAAYHGTKLLGGSEADAQRASLVGSILGGYAASSAAAKFSLNRVSEAKVTSFIDDMSPEDAQRYVAWNVKRKAGLDIVLENDIVLTSKGLRPHPTRYLSDDYLKNHLSQFENGATIIMTKEQYITYVKGNPTIGIVADQSQFVMPKDFGDNVILGAKGDISKIESALGFDVGHFADGGGLIRIDVANLDEVGLRLPSGNEFGANNHWLPGGFTDGGVPEGVTGLIPNNSANVSISELK
ncbi:T7SS effector LXG polymorphic toxin [Streptococcus acidominimus]|uniref:Membrane protein n=1 Tax=Streptococcus acidominimus TaxID=1326 RepID=A0A1Q8EC53_STRAI|nr:T7SS effector LXG polymorphic toxin [Streptococcus acidominimus]OLF49342.1 hypothetical protein BU200_07870 [Streptococcus acidominimus]SUN07526.1 membrane protein [Streptococcus acidominimus]